MTNTKEQKMRPIWYFVGWVLTLIGGLVVLSGVYNLYFSIPNTTVFTTLDVGYWWKHPNLWWGGFLLVVGVFYTWLNKDVRIG